MDHLFVSSLKWRRSSWNAAFEMVIGDDKLMVKLVTFWHVKSGRDQYLTASESSLQSSMPSSMHRKIDFILRVVKGEVALNVISKSNWKWLGQLNMKQQRKIASPLKSKLSIFCFTSSMNKWTYILLLFLSI